MCICTKLGRSVGFRKDFSSLERGSWRIEGSCKISFDDPAVELLTLRMVGWLVDWLLACLLAAWLVGEGEEGF